MKRMLVCALLTALLAGCVVVPLHNDYDGYDRGGPRFGEHHHDGSRYHQDEGYRGWDHGG